MDLLIKAVEESGRTRSDHKRDIMARILCGAVLRYKRGAYSPEEYLNLISDMTERELMVASSYYNRQPKQDYVFRSWANSLGRELGMDATDIGMVLARLEARGLISKSELSALDARGYSPESARFAPEKSIYAVSPMFRKLMDFLALENT
jgi:hypothetical protein